MINIHPTTRALCLHIPEAHPISPAELWAYRKEGTPDDSFPRLVVDLAAMARAGLIKRHPGDKAMYTRSRLTIEDAGMRAVMQRFESGWLLPNTATKAVADDYERRLRLRYPVVRFKDGVWVRVDEVVERKVA